MMSEALDSYYLHDSYRTWCDAQGVPFVEDFGIDLMNMEVKPWDTYGMNGAICELVGGDDFISTFCFEIPPGGKSRPLSHVYEEVIFVLSGHVSFFWGGGMDTQKILPFGTPAEVAEEVKQRIDDLAPQGGFVFAAVHNIQADVPPENIVAAFQTALEYGKY